MNPIQIIGIGQGTQDLTLKHMDLIRKCDILIGGRRHLSLFDFPEIEKISISGHISNIVDIIKKKMDHKKIVVLASGDPLFYGIGSTLTRYFDKKYLNIYSNISSVSAAFAAIKEPWHDAKIVSLHGRHQPLLSFSKISCENKVVFLTDPERNPEFIAAELIKEDITNHKLCVLENLGDQNKEKITWFENIKSVREHQFSQPNIVILLKKVKEKQNFAFKTHIGMEDSEFKHSKGLITKSEIRCLSLSKLNLTKKDHIIWDIGSGSGSFGIEASLLVPMGQVYAIEKHPERINDIIYNIKKFNCCNIKVLNLNFPEGIQEIKIPDRIFIGGGGKHLEKIINAACSKLSDNGIIVINTILIQNLEIALKLLKQNRFDPQAIQVQVSRSKDMPFGKRFEALNPVWIISGTKPESQQI